MSGLVKGIEGQIPKLLNTLHGISDDIAGTRFSAKGDIEGVGVAAGAGTTNIYINGTKINDDMAIEGKFTELMSMMARKGLM